LTTRTVQDSPERARKKSAALKRKRAKARAEKRWDRTGAAIAERIIARLESRGLLPLAEQIARENFVVLEEYLGPRRYSSLVLARKKLYHELYVKGLSTTEIGTLLERDNATIWAGCKV
jgi:hypothetical protein